MPQGNEILPLSLSLSLSLSLTHTHTQTHTHTRTQGVDPAYLLCTLYSLPPKHHKITASDKKKIRNALLLFFTLIKVSNSLPKLDCARRIYGNFGSANGWSQKDKYCFCCVGVCHHNQHLFRPKADVSLCDVSLGT